MQVRIILFIALAYSVPAVAVVVSDSSGQESFREAAKQAIRTIPATQPASDIKAERVQSLFFKGPEYQHQSTRVFAWHGMPADLKPNAKVPAMVLVHGGGGTAFAEWVRLWNARGYAAIAMDTCGCVPIGSDNHWKRDEKGGPPGWGGFDQVDKALTDQWTYHAVLDVILAHSLIRSWPQVDEEHVGVTGISWGGYLTCIAAGLDDRFKFACPVYGCGYLGEDSAWLGDLKNMSAGRADRWLKAWDPAEYLPDSKMPMLWVDGTNDAFYPPDSLAKSYQLPKGPRTLVMRVAMKHSHRDGWSVEEIGAYADSFCGKGVPLVSIQSQTFKANMASATYVGSCSVVKAELNFTTDSGSWQKRKWEIRPADLLQSERKVQAAIPANATAFYTNLMDEKGRTVSTDLDIR